MRTTVSSLHFFDTVQWLDKGNYTCRTYNGAHIQSYALTNENEGISLSTTQLAVVHEPTILNEKFSDYALAAASVGATVNYINLKNITIIKLYLGSNCLSCISAARTYYYLVT